MASIVVDQQLSEEGDCLRGKFPVYAHYDLSLPVGLRHVKMESLDLL